MGERNRGKNRRPSFIHNLLNWGDDDASQASRGASSRENSRDSEGVSRSRTASEKEPAPKPPTADSLVLTEERKECVKDPPIVVMAPPGGGVRRKSVIRMVSQAKAPSASAESRGSMPSWIVTGSQEEYLDWAKEGGDVDAWRDEATGRTALHYVSAKGYSLIFKRLLRMPHLDLNVEDADGATPIKLAIEGRHLYIVEVLLLYGAKISPATGKEIFRLIESLDMSNDKYHPLVAFRCLALWIAVLRWQNTLDSQFKSLQHPQERCSCAAYAEAIGKPSLAPFLAAIERMDKHAAVSIIDDRKGKQTSVSIAPAARIFFFPVTPPVHRKRQYRNMGDRHSAGFGQSGPGSQKSSVALEKCLAEMGREEGGGIFDGSSDSGKLFAALRHTSLSGLGEESDSPKGRERVLKLREEECTAREGKLLELVQEVTKKNREIKEKEKELLQLKGKLSGMMEEEALEMYRSGLYEQLSLDHWPVSRVLLSPYHTREIWYTEKKNVEANKMIFEHFVTPLNALSPLPPPSNIAKIQAMFQSVPSIFKTSEELLRCLEEQYFNIGYAKGKSLGDVFLMMGEYLKVYAPLLNKYNETEIRTEREHHPQFAKLCDDFEMHTLGKVELYLARLMQRPTKYPLLLRSLLENTPESHPERPTLMKAYEFMLQIAAWWNEQRRMTDRQKRLLDKEKKLGVSLVEPSRFLIEDVPCFCDVTKPGKLTRAILCLCNDMIIISEQTKKQQSKKKEAILLVIPLSDDVTIFDLPNFQGGAPDVEAAERINSDSERLSSGCIDMRRGSREVPDMRRSSREVVSGGVSPRPHRAANHFLDDLDDMPAASPTPDEGSNFIMSSNLAQRMHTSNSPPSPSSAYLVKRSASLTSLMPLSSESDYTPERAEDGMGSGSLRSSGTVPLGDDGVGRKGSEKAVPSGKTGSCTSSEVLALHVNRRPASIQNSLFILYKERHHKNRVGVCIVGFEEDGVKQDVLQSMKAAVAALRTAENQKYDVLAARGSPFVKKAMQKVDDTYLYSGYLTVVRLKVMRTRYYSILTNTGKLLFFNRPQSTDGPPVEEYQLSPTHTVTITDESAFEFSLAEAKKSNDYLMSQMGRRYVCQTEEEFEIWTSWLLKTISSLQAQEVIAETEPSVVKTNTQT
eukprot:CAMPEP_0119130250 /NCGR_PEP_ID=MMETSP1310-20130426/7661_1 /TAXON_ID=464262 /ORGANISM="Genus nov. species nov., Strain RCC2339" /LENGTH=1139 /DNA_ID=CAMNT_0007120741 /DNA_START=174 /DNA_END=3593 /DNA_ORIENTATION=+